MGKPIKKNNINFSVLKVHLVFHAPVPFSLGTLDDNYESEKL
jgi:hypothetical protein